MRRESMMIFLGIIMLCLTLNIGIISSSAVPCNPDVTIVNQDPSPAVPGSYLKIMFEVSGLGNCDGYTVKLNPDYPFSLDIDTNPIQKISGNPFAEGYSNTWMVPYRIRVADDALEGSYNLKLIYQEGTEAEFASYAEKNFNITVTDVQTDFATVIQDTSGTQVSIGIVNTGKNMANSLIVGIPDQENYAVSGTAEKIVGNLAAGDYTIVSFDVTSLNQRNPIKPNGNSTQTKPSNGQQTLKIQLDYTDGIGKRRTLIKEVKLSLGSSTNTTNGASSTQFQRSSRNSSANISAWIYVVVIIVILVIIAAIYKGYHKVIIKKIKNTIQKNNDNKKPGSAPEWVSSERQKKK